MLESTHTKSEDQREESSRSRGGWRYPSRPCSCADPPLSLSRLGIMFSPCSRPTASIQTIPVELVQEILIHAIDPGVDAQSVIPTFPPGHHPNATRATLLQLDRAFAHLVLHTPRLWSNLILDDSIPISHLLYVIQTSLERSRPCRLNIVLHLERLFPVQDRSGAPTYRYTQRIKGNPGVLVEAFRMLSREIGRVQRLVMDLRHPRRGCFPSLWELFPPNDVKMSCLEELVLLGFIGNGSAKMTMIHAPRLRALDVEARAVRRVDDVGRPAGFCISI